MRLVGLALVLFTAGGAIAAEGTRLTVPDRCASGLKPVEKPKQPERPRKLGELPPADAYLTIYREVDGCPKPIVVRRDIGAPGR